MFVVTVHTGLELCLCWECWMFTEESTKLKAPWLFADNRLAASCLLLTKLSLQTLFEIAHFVFEQQIKH